ncbi:MAG: hypothetical protein JWM74_1461 [Myxococcaceae bacterium]|nr:hypothetical protein [Myxococcaceae bacterium]
MRTITADDSHANTGHQASTTWTAERQAYEILHWGFVAAPVLMGLDKFAQLLTDWDAYVAPPIARALGGSTHGFMLVVGGIEIAAGLLVALRPRIGAYVVAAWLAGIIVNLLVGGHFLDVALRDFGLCLGALALARLSQVYDRPTARRASAVP